MKISPTRLPGVMLVEPRLFEDQRGYFMETWNERAAAQGGIEARFVQDNHSRSHRDILRGLHYQQNRPQGKLVRVVQGAAFDVAVDLRPDSATFGRWTGHVLSAENRHMLWVPPGFAHGFLSLSDDTHLLYKCTDYYAPADERALIWNDPDIGIEWPIVHMPCLSARDAAAGRLVDMGMAA
ncbi:dTDP-4-dehydrorhamnose 3,5-epimerase [Sphingobium sp. PNB]|uniref:dTDP-4-dehydrorhamnose 3,5-epimerase n=1 Tax=Sphingobium sp. PNB TaxID=863934 RepID=UPI001CA4111D|nr:dTDP-4-dehydrorhamnose 3,5-epimerase [Sphingobium sp. PNB]MCB4858139.1 dTDP-4-dehydrorhamnose 3,5-epimerase [Sphingobium sp. PNB]